MTVESAVEEAGVATTPASEATFYHQATPATTYWRCELPARYLPGRVHAANELEVQIADDEEKTISFPDLEGHGAVVQFPGDHGTALCLVAIRSAGKKFFVEVDDNYLDHTDPLWHQRAGWGRQIGDRPHTREGHRWIVENADGVFVTTPALRERYLEFNDNVVIARNSIDPDDWPAFLKPRDDVFRIGWYASQSHDRDESEVRKALAWASRQPNVEVITIGLNPGWAFTRLWVPWRTDFSELRQELYKLDVGIAPLVGTPMTRYRSDLKALEYSMAGAMPMLQGGLPVYEAWREQPFARMCWTPQDWVEAIRWAVKNQDEARQLGAQAREFVLRERTFATEINVWKEALGAC